jgi:methionyl-tRNA synthetase
MAAGLPLPIQIHVHGHWTRNNQKMSKSLGNVVSPFSLLERYDPDVLRYYMIKEGGSDHDGNWSENSLKMRYTYLANSWGNLVMRMLSPRMNLRLAISQVFRDGKYHGVSSMQPLEDQNLRRAVEAAIDLYRKNMEKLDLGAALSIIDSLWRVVSSYLRHSLLIRREINT